MPQYRWSCHACGESNPRESRACAACGCPAAATSAAIGAHRTALVAAGGRLHDSIAGSSVGDLSAFEVLVQPILRLVFGLWWPRLSDFRSGRR